MSSTSLRTRAESSSSRTDSAPTAETMHGLPSPVHCAAFTTCLVLPAHNSITMLQVGNAITTLPDDIEPHRMVKKVYEQRRQMMETGEGIDWGFAEALAFGTLLSEGRSSLEPRPGMCSSCVLPPMMHSAEQQMSGC